MAVAAETMYISADTIPGVAEERQAVREEAWALIGHRKELQATGHGAELPPVLDALSTAEYVLEAEKGSEEYTFRLGGLRQDCLRLVSEWFRKKRPEYFPPVRHTYDAQAVDFYSHGLAIGQMTLNALRPIVGKQEEVARRVNERVEHETTRILRSMGSVALGGARVKRVRTLSECTDTAIKEYAHDQKIGAPHGGYDGYVPEIEKLMVRDMISEEETDDRLQEQVGLPGIYFNHDIITRALERRSIDAKDMDKTALHGTQLIVEDDLMEFTALLDEVASEQWCVNIFMGEQVPDGYIKDYAGFRAEALRRQDGLKDLAHTVATFVLDLAANGFDKTKAPKHVENFVKKLLLEEAKKDIAVAEQMFNIETALGLQEVVRLEEAGYHQEAFKLMQVIEKEAPGGGYCSGGACGLESIDLSSDIGQEIKAKLKAKDGDIIVKDTDRKCKCGAKEVYYAYTSTKVNKYCDNCGAYESKQTSVSSDE